MLPLLALVLGIAGSALLPQLPAWPVLVLITVLPALLYWRWRRRFWLCLLLLALGLAYACVRAEWRLAHSLSPAAQGQTVWLIGQVRDLPQAGEQSVRLRLQVEQVLTPGVTVPPLLELRDYARQSWPAGSRWRLALRLRPVAGTLNAAGFDAEAWYWSEGMLATGTVAAGRQALGEGRGLLPWLDRQREAIATRLLQTTAGQDARASALVAALAVGAQQSLDSTAWQALAATGLTHIVSVSGMHITLLAVMVAGLCRYLLRLRPVVRQPLLWSLLAGLAAAWAYALLAGFSVPTQRTVWMLSMAVLALSWQRALTALQIWLAALVLVLLLDPFAVLAAGFWLSFGLVAALILLYLGRRARPGRWRMALDAQYTATVASIVPLAAFFGQLPLVSPLANALAAPFVSLLLTPAALLAALLPWPPLLQLAQWLAVLFWWWVDLLAQASLWSVAAAPWPLWLAASAGSLWLIAPLSPLLRSYGLCLLLPLLMWRPLPPEVGRVRVTVLDVGQGLSVLLQTRQHTLLYDTGAGEAGRVVLPQLRAAGVGKLDALLLSHHDNDHDGAAAGVWQGIKVGRMLAGQPQFYPHAQPCRQGQHWQWDGVRFEVLWPRANSRGEDNAHSCVLRVLAGGQALLLTGDAPQAVEQQLLTVYGHSLYSQFLLLGHHGSKSSSSGEFLATVAPQRAIISAGFANRYRHPHPLVLHRLQTLGIAEWRTDRDGAIRFELGGADPAANLARQQQARYWRRPWPTAP